MKLATRVVKGAHGLRKLPPFLVEAIGPFVGHTGYPLPAYFHGLLIVRIAGAQPRYLVRVGGLGDFLAAEAHVAAVGFGGVPAQRFLLGGGPREEGCGRGEDVLHGGGGDAGVGEVEEAAGAEGVEDGLGG